MSRKKLLECEARQWLVWGYTTQSKVNALMNEIKAIRGEISASELRNQMRVEWKKMKR